MTTHKLIAFTLGLILLGAGASAQAGGCYVCTTGSSAACRDYCQYEGADTFDNRHKCEARGCKIGGTTTCPSAPAAGGAGEAKVCQVQGSGATVAACMPRKTEKARGPAT